MEIIKRLNRALNTLHGGIPDIMKFKCLVWATRQTETEGRPCLYKTIMATYKGLEFIRIQDRCDIWFGATPIPYSAFRKEYDLGVVIPANRAHWEAALRELGAWLLSISTPSEKGVCTHSVLGCREVSWDKFPGGKPYKFKYWYSYYWSEHPEVAMDMYPMAEHDDILVRPVIV